MPDADWFEKLAARKWVVYALAEPVSGHVRYVGWTTNLRVRIRDHMKPSRLVQMTRRDKWIKALLAKGLRPSVIVLEEGCGGAWPEAERRWISHHRAAGADLTNHTDGGEGAVGRPHTEDAKRRMSEKRKGRKPSQAAIDASVARARATKNPEAIAAMNAAIRGKPKSTAHRAKLAASKIGRTHTAEARAKMSAKRRGRKTGPQSAEVRARMSAARKGKPNDAKRAWWAKMSPDERSAYVKELRGRRRENDGGAAIGGSI